MARPGDQMLEPGRQLERVGYAKLAVERRVASAIVATDDEGDVVAEGLMDVAADVIVCQVTSNSRSRLRTASFHEA